jgi:hypothetical protein
MGALASLVPVGRFAASPSPSARAITLGPTGGSLALASVGGDG